MKRSVLSLLLATIALAPSSELRAAEDKPSDRPTAATSGSASMDALDDKHLLSLGDRLSFRIAEDNEDPKPLIVTDSGELEVPYIGRVPVLNKTCRQAARDIKTELEKEYYFQATVILAVDQLSKSRGRVYIVGYIRMPGPQEIPTDEVFTLSKAIMRAGGFGDFADKKHVKVTRKDPATPDAPEKTLVINVNEILEGGKTSKDLKLEPGDMIYVPSRLVNL